MITIDFDKTAQNIKNYRTEKGISVSELAERMGGYSPQSVYKWESGINLPTIDNLVMLAEIFDVTVDDIVAVSR